MLGFEALGVLPLGGSEAALTYKVTFSTFKNTELIDWREETYDSNLLVNWFVPEDVITKTWTPYIYVFTPIGLKTVTDNNLDPVVDQYGDLVYTRSDTSTVVDQNGVMVTNSSGLEVYSTPSLLMRSGWNWKEPESANPIQVYRTRDNYLNTVSKNRVRGRGRTLQLKFEGEGAADFHLQGWGIFFTKNTET